MVYLFQTSTAEMQQAVQRRYEILARLGSAVGLTQAIQAVGAAVDVIIGQNQQIISYMTATAADQVADRNEGKTQVEYSRRVMQEYEARKREAATGFR